MPETEKDALKKRLDVANKEILRLQTENTALIRANDVLISEKKQWELQKTVQEQIIQNSLNQSNAKNNEMLRQIEYLDAELRKCRSQ